MSDSRSPETPNPSQSESAKFSPVSSKRRTLIAGLAALGAYLGIARTSQANAQTLKEGPKPATSNQTDKSDGKNTIISIDSDASSQTPDSVSEKVPESLRNAIENRVKISENFLLKLPGEERMTITTDYQDGDANGRQETNASNYYGERNIKKEPKEVTILDPHLTVSYSSEKPLTQEAILKDVEENLVDMVLESHRNKPLPRYFSDILSHYLKIDLNKIESGIASSEDMAKFAQLQNFFGLNNWSYERRNSKILSRTMLKSVFCSWLYNPEELVQRLNRVESSETKTAIASVYRGSLKLLIDCASPEIPSDSVGLDQGSINEVVRISEERQPEAQFPKKAA